MNRLRRHEDGFTLVELIVSIVIASILVGAIATALIVAIKTSAAAADRLSQSHDSQLLSLYLPRDVQSAAAAPDTAPGASGCTGVDGGTNSFRLTWTDPSTSPTTRYVADYRVDGTNLVRYFCVDTTGSGAAPEKTTVVHNLSGAAPVQVTGDRLDPLRIDVAVTVDSDDNPNSADPYTFTISASRRTSATCEIASFPNPPDAYLSTTSGQLANPVTVGFSTVGPCAGSPTVVHTYDNTAATVTEAPAGGPSQWTVTLPAVLSSGRLWTSGDKTIRVTVSSGATATAILKIRAASTCTASAPSFSPSPTLDSSGTLTPPVTVTVATGGTCSGLSLSYQYGATVSAYNVLALSQAGNSWTAQLPANPGGTGWTAGPKTYTLSYDGHSIDGTFTVAPYSACAVGAVALSPSSVNRTTSGSVGPVNKNVDVSFTLSPSCVTPPTITYQPNSTTAPTTIPATLSSGTWIGQLPKTAQWEVGARTVTATSGAVTSSATLTVNALGCALSSPTLSPSSVAIATSENNNGGNSGSLAGSVTASVTDTLGGCTGTSMTLTYQFGSSSHTASLTTTSATGTWTFTIPAAANTWTTGAKAVSAVLGSEAPSSSATLQVTQGCGASSNLALTPTSAKVKNGNLDTNITAAFTLTAACSAPTLRYSPDSTNGSTGWLSASVSGGPSYTATLPKNPTRPWTAGTRPVQVLVGTILVSTATLTVTT